MSLLGLGFFFYIKLESYNAYDENEGFFFFNKPIKFFVSYVCNTISTIVFHTIRVSLKEQRGKEMFTFPSPQRCGGGALDCWSCILFAAP